jgi:hypothetical protein
MFDGGGPRRTGRGELQPGQIEFDAPLYALSLPCLPRICLRRRRDLLEPRHAALSRVDA